MPSLRSASPSRRRGPGRPARREESAPADEVRAQLMRAAESLFAQRGYGAVGVREIARSARVSPAMISYYFRDKAGLLDAVLEGVFERLIAQVTRLASDSPSATDPFDRLIRVLVATLAEEPWLPSFVLREVLGGSAATRARFAKRFPARIAPVVLPLIQREVASGRLRRDLEPPLAILSLLGMCMFPFLAQPLIGPALGYQLDARFTKRLAEHTTRLFREGTQGETR